MPSGHLVSIRRNPSWRWEMLIRYDHSIPIRCNPLRLSSSPPAFKDATIACSSASVRPFEFDSADPISFFGPPIDPIEVPFDSADPIRFFGPPIDPIEVFFNTVPFSSADSTRFFGPPFDPIEPFDSDSVRLFVGPPIDPIEVPFDSADPVH